MTLALHSRIALVLLFTVSACGSGSGGTFGSGTLEEAANPAASASPVWWLSSGALLSRDGDSARTIQGELEPGSPWRERYRRSNPVDTENGARPQNVFRLVHREVFGNLDQRVRFRIHRTNATASPNRNRSNGVFLFFRYLGENDLYAAGVRVDGQAVIKRKKAGQNTTLAIQPLFGAAASQGAQNPNIIPENTPVELRTIARSTDEGLAITLFVDGSRVLDAVDPAPVASEGLTGIRSDFLDLEIDGYRVAPGG